MPASMSFRERTERARTDAASRLAVALDRLVSSGNEIGLPDLTKVSDRLAEFRSSSGSALTEAEFGTITALIEAVTPEGR